MSIFFDPKKHKTKLWVSIFLVVIPITLGVSVWLGSKPFVEKYRKDLELKSLEKEPDIFKTLDLNKYH